MVMGFGLDDWKKQTETKGIKFSIVTPTILRPSLIRACKSLDNQAYTNWEHLVMVDCEISNDVLAKIQHPQRRVFRCETPHRNWGHSCRVAAYAAVTGDYIYYLDDDNYLADAYVLSDLSHIKADWALLPILRHNEKFFNNPPAFKGVDTGSFVVKKEFGKWSESTNYAADWETIKKLMSEHPDYETPFGDNRIAMVMPESHVPGRAIPTNGNRVSIFTPVHNNTYLREAYESIKDQDFFEWIVVFNNGGVPTDFGDSRVKIHVLYKAPEKVGALKAYACEQAAGDILLELDCDDMLMPHAVEKVQIAFKDPEVGFVYSNAIHCNGDLEPREKFTELMGWKYRDVEVNGKKLYELVSFPPTPESISRVWFGPDHLRAFRRSTYEQIGGYNKDMQILDDSDICCRLYLAAKTIHIDEGLYVYRVHGQNSWLRFNQDIQNGVYKIYDQYIESLVERWCELNNLKMLDLGNSTRLRPGYRTENLSDFNWLPDNYAGVIRATDYLNMQKNPLQAMKEISRILVPGGWLFAQVPSTDGRGAFQDPRHISFWNENSFLYYTHRNWAQYIGTPVRFQAPRLYTTEKNKQQVCWTIAHLINLKNGYRPCGLLEI
jgi:O-antigen biosynthesis protein